MEKNNYMFIIVIIVLVLGGTYLFINKSNYKTEDVASTNIQQQEQQVASFFVTSANPGKGGDLGGLAGADAYCNTLAQSAGVSGKTWHAYLSAVATDITGAVNARDRIGSGPWYNANGILVANTIVDLHGANNLNKMTALTEKGAVVFGRGDDVNLHDILTGSNADGSVLIADADTTCNNWTSSAEGSAYVGHHDRMGIDDSAPMKSWNSSHASRGCSMENLKSTGGGGLFYCFAQ